MAKISNKFLLIFSILFYNSGKISGQNLRTREVNNVTDVVQVPDSENQDGGESFVETTTVIINEIGGNTPSLINNYTSDQKAVKQISVFKCSNSSLEGENFQVPIWLQQFMSAEREDELSEEYGEYFYQFKLLQAPFDCTLLGSAANTDAKSNQQDTSSNPTEFYFEKNETEDLFLALRTKVSMHSVNTKMNGFFLPNGYLKYNFEGVNYYYPPGSYCLNSLSPDEVEGFFCPNNVQMTPEGNATKLPQIRKCVGMGFLVQFDPLESSVFEILEVEEDEWEAFLYENTRKASERNLQPIYTQSRINCTKRTVVVTDPDIVPYMKKNTYSGVRILETGDAFGRVKGSGKWEDLAPYLNLREFCIDGYIDINDNEYKNNSVYQKRQDRQIIIGCEHIPISTSFTLTDAYAYVLFIPTLLLLIIVVIYSLVWTKQNIHGRTSAAFVFSMFIFFCSLILSNVSVFKIGSTSCMVNGMVQHYFYLSMFYWMAVMNFDVWSTIRSMVAVSQRSKGNKRLMLYCCVAFGIPAIVLAISISLHSSYRIDEERVILPMYGYYTCAVDKTVQLYYNLSPVAFVFITSIVFGLMTMYTLYKLKKDTKRIETSNTKNSQKQWHVILKLFLLTGVSWFSELIYNIWYPDAAWYFFILDCYNFFQAFFLFSIFVCKPEIRNQLSEKYSIFKKLFQLWDNHSTNIPIIGSTKRSPAENNSRSQTFDSSTFTTNSEVQSESC